MSITPSSSESAEQLQREYYAQTVNDYDRAHLHNEEEREHAIALAALSGLIHYYKIESVLDVGAGTGRAIRYFNALDSWKGRVLGIEPVAEMRAAGHAAGIPSSQLIEGNALQMQFEDNEFDIVSAFGVLHHIQDPNPAIKEMFRVARKGIFISDMNNFGCGSAPARLAKQIARALKLWAFVQRIATRGKGYKFTQGDGVHYSYSIYDSIPLILKYCAEPIILTTKGFGVNPYRSCSHIAVLAMKDSH